MGRRENLTIESDTANLPRVRQVVEAGSRRAGFSQQQCDAIVLAVDEALANVIKHAYGGAKDKKIVIDIEELNEQTETRGLTICIRDFGKGVDVSQIKGRDLKDIRPGGLGVHIIRKIMDEVVYESLPDGGTRLRMVKYHDKESEGQKQYSGRNQRPRE